MFEWAWVLSAMWYLGVLIYREDNQMKRKTITVLDYSSARVFQYFVKINVHSEDFIQFKGHRLKDVEWMEHQISNIITN